jgi:hypothetical protein
MTEPTDFTPYAAGVPTPSAPPRPPAPGHLAGQAEGVAVRSESDPHVSARLVTVLGFRLRVPGRPPLEVELRGLSLTGAVRDGDWVEVADRPGPNGMFAVASVTNLTTGLPVSVRSPRHLGGAVAVVLALVLLLAMLGVVGLVLTSLLTF